MHNPHTVLVTGGAGFIGMHVAQALLARGCRVIALDNLDPFYDPAIKRRNVTQLADAASPEAGFRFVEGDVRDADLVQKLYHEHDPSATIHLAAKAGVRPSIADPAGYASVNLQGTANVLEASRKACPEAPFVLASSSSVYGNNTKVPFAEGDPVEDPISPYAASKRACELMARTHHHLYGMPIACLRFFTVFGPGQRPDLAIAKFLRMIAAGEPIPVFGDGTTSRDYTFIDNIVAGVLAAAERAADHGFRIWNLGSDAPITLAEMIATIERVVGREANIDRKPMQPGDVDRTYADLTRSRAELDYAPESDFEAGVRAQWAATEPALPVQRT